MVRKMYKILFWILFVGAVAVVYQAVSTEIRENYGCPIGYHIETVVTDWCVVN